VAFSGTSRLRVFVAISLLLTFHSLAQTTAQSLNNNWQFTEAGKNEWLSAIVPGTVHTDLLAHGKIPDPFIGENEKQVQWVETKTWEYKTTFDASADLWKNKHKELIFEGLDTYARVYLNDSLILTGENMFLEYRIDVTKSLKKTGNILRIDFLPIADLIAKNKKLAGNSNLPGGDRVYVRKAQYQFGWDFGPRLVTAGIWKNVRLEGWNDYKLEVRIVNTEIKKDTAFLALYLDYTAIPQETNITVEVSDESHNYLKSKFQAEKGMIGIGLKLSIPHPRLWWCNGMGKQNIYHFKISLTIGKSKAEAEVNHAIRIFRLDTSKDDAGNSFALYLNGEPVFIKGSNWIPADNFLPRMNAEKYYSLLKTAQQSNMNMLRVWGGGVYENDNFYNDCDSLGIMVWQDFMYAGGIYPASEKFMYPIRMEVEQQFNRLDKHACVALWCGNNEIEEGWKNWDWQKEMKISSSDSLRMWNDERMIFSNLIPGAIHNMDSMAIYVSSSPATGWGHAEAYKSGDVHYWGVWWGMEPFASYDNHVGRFVSEYGFQGLPPVSSLAAFDNAGYMDKNDPQMKAHEKHPKGFETIDEYMKRDYPAANGIADYSYISQVMQRDGISRAIEDHRRAMPYCMGTMYWQYDDCWPGITWSTTDYYGQKKLLQYAIKDLYAPLLVSAIERNDSILIYVINDDTVSHKGVLAFAYMDMTGNVARTSFTPTTIYTGRSMMVLGFQKKEFFDRVPATEGVFRMVFNYENDQSVQSIHYFATGKALKLPADPGLISDIVPLAGKPGSYTITLRTISLAKNVYLSLPDVNATFSDNGFDMLPGDTKDVIITTSLSEADLKAQLKIQLMNSFVK
jgi:beta-mannosidase